MGDIQSVVNWFYLHEFESNLIEFDDHVVVAIEKALEISRLDAETYGIGNKIRIWNALRRQIEEHNRRELFPAFTEVPGDWRRLIWNPKYFPPGLSKKAKHQRLRYKSRSHILQMIEQLLPREYEAVSVLACKLSGASHYCLTRHNDDRGVDFFALLPSVGGSRLLNGAYGPIRIVGQSKKYSRSLEREQVENFAYTLQTIRHRNEKITGLIPSWFSQQKGVIIGWIVAHNGLQGGAEEESHDHGILYSDRWDIAEILTHSRSWQPSPDVSAPAELMKSQVEMLLETSNCD